MRELYACGSARCGCVLENPIQMRVSLWPRVRMRNSYGCGIAGWVSTPASRSRILDLDAGLAGADERASATTKVLCHHGPCDPNHGGDSNATARHAGGGGGGGTTRGELGCRVAGFPSLKKCNKTFKRTEDKEYPWAMVAAVGLLIMRRIGRPATAPVSLIALSLSVEDHGSEDYEIVWGWGNVCCHKPGPSDEVFLNIRTVLASDNQLTPQQRSNKARTITYGGEYGSRNPPEVMGAALLALGGTESIDYGGTYKVKNETRTTVTPLNAQGTNREGHCRGGQRELRARRTRRNVGEVEPNIGTFPTGNDGTGAEKSEGEKKKKKEYNQKQTRSSCTNITPEGMGMGMGSENANYTYRTRAVNIDVFQELKSARNRAEESEGEEKEKEKEYNQEHTRSNAQYQDHELRRGATRYAHAQAHSTDCELRQNITPEGENGNGERNANYTRTTRVVNIDVLQESKSARNQG
ncbi:hypothetical protein BJY52DRAFT_1229171 [Lactarius psammicola]|nr:hypothetical protein BJY52DRAFT_1229171 [Lactarius psammicola]